MSGSQIGGAVGAVVGGIIGFYAGGNVAAGVKYGYAIGSALGAYVDPVKTRGPRLTDATEQTSSVGIPIPFGYGTYTCNGNVIWRDRLVEHKKTKRVGKGSSQKNTTYTYTRSYAIGVSETITSYVWIKRNGKLVYAADPAVLGASMGWSSQQINDLYASSSKFLQMATLYYGTDTQMPDSTIVAVEGAGNVSPFRDLAYIVLENEDLTDMQGAISQYEFCVFRGSAKSYTTPPYPVYFEDSLSVSSINTRGGQATWAVEDMDISAEALGGEIRNIVQIYNVPFESADVTLQPLGGNITSVLKTYNMQPEEMNITSLTPLGGDIQVIVRHYQNYAPEEMNIGVTPLGGAFT